MSLCPRCQRNFRIAPGGNIDSVRFDLSNPGPLMTALPSGMLPVRMAIVSGFEIRVAVLHDSGPPVPRERDVEMTYPAPIVRIDGVKSLVPRQFLANFATGPPCSAGEKSDVNHYAIIRRIC